MSQNRSAQAQRGGQGGGMMFGGRGGLGHACSEGQELPWNALSAAGLLPAAEIPTGGGVGRGDPRAPSSTSSAPRFWDWPSRSSSMGIVLKMQHVPGASIDFAYIDNILLILVGLYLISSIFGYVQQYIMAGVAQRTVYRMRKEVDEKLARLPLKYYDSRTHGEILSRAVNDMDNISTTLQQNLTQFITSVVTVVGVIVLMLTISPLLTLVVVVTLPLSILVTTLIAKRSQTYFANQQRALGRTEWPRRGDV